MYLMPCTAAPPGPGTLAARMPVQLSTTSNSVVLPSPRLAQVTAEIVALNSGRMNKNVFFDVMSADEAISGLYIEPYHGSQNLGGDQLLLGSGFANSPEMLHW